MANPYQPSLSEIDILEKQGSINPEQAAQMRQSAAPATPLVDAANQLQQSQMAPPAQMPSVGGMVKDAASTVGNWLMAPEGTPPQYAPSPASAPQVQPMDQASQAPAPTEFEAGPQPAQPAANPYGKFADGVAGGYNMQRQAYRDAGKAGAELATETSNILAKQQKDGEKLEADRVQREMDRHMQFEKETKSYEDIQNQLLNSKVDPNRYWNSQSNGQKVLAGIGIILGGIGAGMTKTNDNPAMDIINNAIKNDIDAQKSDLEKLKSVGGMKQNLLSMMRDKFSDERQAEAATKHFMLGQTQLKLQEMAAKYKAPEVKAQADAAIGQLEVQKQSTLAQFEAASKAKQVMLGGGQQLPPGVDIEQLSEDQRKRYVPGLGLATSEKGKDEVIVMKTIAENVSSGVDELMKFTSMTGDSFNPAARARAKTMAAMLKAQLRTPLVGPGAVNESEWKLLDSIVANPTEITRLDATSRASLETLKNKIQSQFHVLAKNHGLRPIGQQVTTFQPRK